MIGSGKRRHLVSLQRNTALRSATGALLPANWVEYGTEWVEISGLKGGEALQAQALRGQATYVIKGLYRDDVSEADRIVEGAKIYNIKSVYDPTGKRAEIWLTAETGLNNG